MKILEFEVQAILHKLLYSLHVYLVEFGDNTGADEAVLQSKSGFLAIGEDELVEVIEDELERFGVGLIDLDHLRDAAGVEGFVFDATEVTKYFLDFVLHL